MKRRLLSILLAICVMVVMAPAMAIADDAALLTTTTAANTLNSDDIVILATSDVHCGISDNIGYDGLVAYKKAMEAKYANVTLVDVGDAVQGAAIGTLSKGEYLVDIMNEVGYEYAILGNHEFDYGMDQLLNTLIKNAKATYLSCNFQTIADGKAVLEPYAIKTYGKKKVAFIGIATPESLAKSSPAYFQDADGNWMYDFCNDSTGAALYKRVQSTIDDAKKAGADYIVVLGHLGDDAADTEYWKSSDVIKNTTGIDMFIDGHAHQTFVSVVKDKAGKSVKSLATGTKLENIGQVIIKADGTIEAQNIDATVAKDKDADMTAFIKTITDKNDALLKKVVASSTVDLTTLNADGTRAVRSKETNLGDLCADAYKAIGQADIAIVNGGGIRANIAKGNITYENIIAVHPFGNMLCVCEATGQEIVDALEFGSRSVGGGESGGFLQVSGVTYTINPFITSTVVTDDQGMFVKVAGERKVSDVKVNGEPIDLTKTYTVSSHGYLLQQAGDGYTMFQDNKFLQEDVMIDNQVLITYITEKLGGKVGSDYAQAQGRIKVLTADEAMAPTVALYQAAAAKLAVAEYECTVKAVAGAKKVTLTWNAADASDVKYQVYRATSKNGTYKRVITTSKTTYVNKSLSAGKTYYYKVRAIKSIDGSNYYGHYSEVKSAKAK